MTPYYQEQGITIYHANCRDILPDLPRVDLMVTDPPYGIGADMDAHKKSGKQYGRAAAPTGHYDKTDWDLKPIDPDLIALCLSKARDAVIFGGNYYALPPARCWLVWDKVNGETAFADAELAWTTYDRAVRLKRHMWNGMLRKNGEVRVGHPTQKPTEIMSWAITLAPKADVILDPFMGSGTTLRAAKDLGHQAIGIEIEEKYCEMAAKRLSQEVFNFR